MRSKEKQERGKHRSLRSTHPVLAQRPPNLQRRGAAGPAALVSAFWFRSQGAAQEQPGLGKWGAEEPGWGFKAALQLRRWGEMPNAAHWTLKFCLVTSINVKGGVERWRWEISSTVGPRGPCTLMGMAGSPSFPWVNSAPVCARVSCVLYPRTCPQNGGCAPSRAAA